MYKLNKPFASQLYGYALSGIFAIAMVLSMAGAFFSTAQQSEVENRRFNALPELPDSFATWETFPQRFEAFFNDHFGFRAALIRTNTSLSTTLLDRLPSNDVIAGKDDWLFYAAENALALYQRTAPLSPQVMDGWLSGLSERVKWLAMQGVDYAFVVAPDKHTIHAEKMPRYLRVSNVPSQHDQIVDLARANALPVIDLRPTLLAAKADGQVYYRDDTHWNKWGAYLAYRAIMGQLAQRVSAKPVNLQASDFEIQPYGPGDLARMALMQRTEMVPILNTAASSCVSDAEKIRWDAVQSRGQNVGTPLIVRMRCDGGKGKLLLFGDSFSDVLFSYFAASFEEVVAVWSAPTTKQMQELVMQERPDFVLEERVERHLKRIPNPPPKR